MRIIGLLLLFIGFVVSLYSAITYFTADKVVLVETQGSVQHQPMDINWAPYAGIAIMLVGSYIALKSKDNQL